MDPSALPHAGELFSILAALIWAFAVVLFRLSGRSVRPLALNFFKNVVATLMFLITLAVLRDRLAAEASFLDYVLLASSGIIGIAIADTLFFKSLNAIGAGLSQVVGCLYSPLVIVLSTLFLGERMTAWDGVGAGLILLGVLVSATRPAPRDADRRTLLAGIFLGAASFALMALGVVIAKPALDRTPVLWSTTVRLVAGVVALAAISRFSPRRREIWSTLRPSASWKITVPAAFLGAYVAMIVWIAGLKYTQVGTASVLNQTSAIFVLPVAALVLKEGITVRKVIAVAMALGGVALVTLV